MRRTKWLFGLAVILAGLVSCNEDPFIPETLDEGLLKTVEYSQEIIIPDPCGYKEFTLWAGQTINTGQVIVYNDAENLYITVVSNDGFQAIWVVVHVDALVYDEGEDTYTEETAFGGDVSMIPHQHPTISWRQPLHLEPMRLPQNFMGKEAVATTRMNWNILD